MASPEIKISYDENSGLFEAYLHEGQGRDMIAWDEDPQEMLDMISEDDLNKLKEEE